MPADGEKLLAGYLAIERELVAAGRHPTSPAWLETLARFWRSGKRRLTVRKGRQGGGSTTMARVAVATILAGEHRVSHGSRLTFPFVSVSKREAKERLRNVEDVLDVLAVKYARRDDEIELDGTPYFVLVHPCSSRFTRGEVYGAIWEDEQAIWWSDDANANPAVEVDAALVPGLITQPNARVYSISSPLGLDDFHAQLMSAGETDYQCVAEGPSWFWNPTITEASTRELQPVERLWRREFAAIPGASLSSVFDHDAIEDAFVTREPAFDVVSSPVVVCDPSNNLSDRGDDFSAGLAFWGSQPHDPGDVHVWEDIAHPDTGKPMRRRVHDALGHPLLNPDFVPDPPPPTLCIVEAKVFERGLTAAEIVESLVAYARHHGARFIVADPREEFAMASLAHSISGGSVVWTPVTWSPRTKSDAVASVARLLDERRLWVQRIAPAAETLRSQLRAFSEKISGSSVTYSGRGTSHDDLVSLVLNAWMAETRGLMRGGPYSRTRTRRESQPEDQTFGPRTT